MLLILAGISLNLVGGSNGILSRARQAATQAELAKLKESKELADASILMDMYAEGESYKTLYDYIKDKCEQNGEAGGDKILDTGNGSYWLDDEGNMHYKDNDTGSDAKVVQDPEGNVVIKEVTDKRGDTQDMTTPESLTSEIEAAIKDLIKEWKESGSDKTFTEFIQEKCEQSGQDYVETANGGKLFPSDDGKLIYNDTAGNITDIIVTDDGKVIVKELTTADGETKDMTTESSLKKEIDEAISDLKKEWKESGSDKDFNEWLEEKCEENGGSIPTSTGGIIASNGDGTFTYEDGTTPPNTGDFSVDKNGKVKVENVELNKPDNGGGGSGTAKDENSIKSEIDKAMEDLKKEWQESGSELPFDEWLKEKCEGNGGKIPTSTGGQISSNDDGSFTYEDGLTPPNTANINVDKDGNTDVEDVQINNPGNSGTTLPVKDLTIADITFDKKIAGTDQWNADWINQSVVVTAVPNTDLAGYTLQTSKNKTIWKNVDNQTFTTNGTFYVRAFNGKRAGKEIQTEITNIDKKAPEITVEMTTNSYSITMVDEVSKIASYKITETADEPETFEPVDLKETFTTTGEGTPGQTFYAWAKDKAGNVTTTEFTLKEVPAVSNKDFDYTYEPEGWTNQDVLVTAEFKSGVDYAGFTIQTSKDGANWESDNAQNFAENGKMFVRLVDNKGNAGRTTAETIVDKIDKVEPKIDTVTATTKSYQFEASDEGAGLAGYQITADEEEPENFEPIANAAKMFTSPIMENQKNNRPYYIWVKDIAGNVISKKVNLEAVDSATNINITETTVWNGTEATVTFETTSTYQIQICTKASKNDEDWETKNVVTVESGTPIYVRLWDGVNGGSYYTHKPVITYQVKYNANGGAGTMANSTHEYGTAKALNANAFSKIGYTFAGWATTQTGAKVYDNQASVTNLSSKNGDIVNVYAVWTANTNTAYKVVHQQMNVNGNGYTNVETENKTGTSDADVTPAVKTYTGFTSPSTQTVKVAADGSTTVTYKYTRNKYRFTVAGSTGVACGGSSATGDYFYGATISLKATVSAGYTFTQWTSSNTSLSANKTTANTTFTMPAGAIGMTATAKANTNTAYKVVHQQMNVSGSGYTVVKTENLTGTTDTNVSPNVQSYTGFTSPSKQTVKIAGNGTTTVTYNYTRNKYTITYNSNGGSACTATTAYYGASVSMPSPTRDRYTFSGWNTTYTSMPAQNVTVTANWAGLSGVGTSIMKGAWYGDTVNYGTVNGCSNWKVFSKDGSYIYLIAGDKVPSSTLSLSGTIEPAYGDYNIKSTDGVNTTLVNWMTTTSNWSKFVNTTYADLATGGPTMSQLVTSVNGKLGTSYTTSSIQWTYLTGDPYVITYRWYIATPNSAAEGYAWDVDGGNGCVNAGHVLRDGPAAIRPLVRLKSNVKMTWSGSAWNLSV